MRKSTDAQLKASAKYDKQNTRLVQLKLNKKTDADILEFLDSLDNRQGFIKQLIRESITQKIIVNTKEIIDGNFKEGEFVTVRVDGNVYERKVVKGEITIKRIKYNVNDFK